jgi:hypothetical protein
MLRIKAVISISVPVDDKTVVDALFGLNIVSSVAWLIFDLFQINFLMKAFKSLLIFSFEGGTVI